MRGIEERLTTMNQTIGRPTNANGRWERASASTTAIVDVVPERWVPGEPLPPGFTYAVAHDDNRKSAMGRSTAHALVPYQRADLDPVQAQHESLQDGPVIDLYPQRRRVRVRRRKRPWPRAYPWLLALVLIGGMGGGAFWYFSQPFTDATPPAVALLGDETGAADHRPALAADDLRTSESAVIAQAIVKPVRAAELGFTSSGRVKTLLVHEGEIVTAEQPLVQLDDTRQLVAVAQARAGLQQAQAQLLEIQAGARSEEIAAAQAAVDREQAQLDTLLQESVEAADEIAAAADVAAAEARLQQLYAGPNEETLIAARAEARQAEAALATAQAAYDAVAWRNDVGMLPESTQLQQATIAYEAAQASYNELSRGAEPAEISAAQAQVENARATLARVRKPVQHGEVDAARAALRQAQAEVDLLRAGARTEAVAAAQAAVAAAQATLMEAEVALAETTLTAPFAGTVAALDVEIGEQVVAGALVVQLGDVSAWQIETADLVELDVVRVQPGAEVLVTIDALPDVALRGEVVRVKPIGENKIGDMTYTAYITLKESDAALAWNMTATVYIDGQ